MIFTLLTPPQVKNKIGTMHSKQTQPIQLYHGAWVIRRGEKAPVMALAEKRAPFIFSIAGELYAENGTPLPSLLPVPVIDMIIEPSRAKEMGLKGLGYDLNGGYHFEKEQS